MGKKEPDCNFLRSFFPLKMGISYKICSRCVLDAFGVGGVINEEQ